MANNVTVKDGASANTVFKTTDTAGVHVPHHNVDTLTTVTQLPATLGAKAAASSLAVTLSTENSVALADIHDSIADSQAVFGTDVALRAVMHNPDGTVVDFSEVTEFLPQIEVNPDTRTYTIVDISGADTDIVLAVDGSKKHVITGAFLQFSAAGNVTFTQGAGTVTMSVVAGEKWILDDRPSGHFTSTPGGAWSIGKSTNMTITGTIYSKALD